MTGKLIKYEWRSIIKQIGIIWLALPALSIIMSVGGWAFSDSGLISSQDILIVRILSGLTGAVYGVIFLALGVVTVMIVIGRFYKGLLKEEGYLMHTLPVKPWQLITTKGIVAAIVVIISIFVACISILLLNSVGNLSWVFEFIGDLWGAMTERPVLILYGLELVAIALITLLKTIYQFYASMAIGQLVDKHRILLSVGAYIGISMALTTIFTIFMFFVDSDVVQDVIQSFENLDGMAAAQVTALVFFLVMAVQLAVFHVVTERILSKKLNLE